MKTCTNKTRPTPRPQPKAATVRAKKMLESNGTIVRVSEKWWCENPRPVSVLPRTPEADAAMVAQGVEAILAITRTIAKRTARRLGHPKKDTEYFVEFCRSKAVQDARAVLAAVGLLGGGR